MRATEKRYRPLDLEMRGAPGEGAVLEGYVAVFDEWSEVLWEYGVGRFREAIDSRAFAKTIGEADIVATKNHDENYLVGRVRAGVGNIQLRNDDRGLWHSLTIPNTRTAHDVYDEIAAGLIDKMSFKFRKIKDDWDRTPEIPERRLLEVALEDIAYVVSPAYPQTSVDARAAVRSFADAQGLSVEELLEEREATTPEPIEPPAEALDVTPAPEQERHMSLVIARLGVLQRLN